LELEFRVRVRVCVCACVCVCGMEGYLDADDGAEDEGEEDGAHVGTAEREQLADGRMVSETETGHATNGKRRVCDRAVSCRVVCRVLCAMCVAYRMRRACLPSMESSVWKAKAKITAAAVIKRGNWSC
jgi:hypothetical protein